MTNRETLLALAARVEAGETGIAVDAEIFRAFGSPLPDMFLGTNVNLEWNDDGHARMNFGELSIKYTPPAVTTSLDAIAALTERVLPEHQYHVGYTWPNQFGDVGGHYAEIELAFGAGIGRSDGAPTEPAARLAALLRALAEKEMEE